MSCNSCGKAFSLFRKEKGCPLCGYSYCSKCLNYKLFVNKVNAEASVCVKCKNAKSKGPNIVVPPDAYYKRLNDAIGNLSLVQSNNPVDQQIIDRLNKLKKESSVMSADDISKRLQSLKEVVPSTSDAELQERLANLRGVPVSVIQKSTLPASETRTEQEQVDDLLNKYMEQSQIDSSYKDEFDHIVNNMESRLAKLKGASSKDTTFDNKTAISAEHSSDEEELVSKIVEKIKKESLENDSIPAENDELPFCEICNEDATMRCLGCQYLFCKRCFHEHKDDDDGCNRYELYLPTKHQ